MRIIKLCGALVAGTLAVTAAKAEPVKITFLPPPMEGTISLGVYDTAGKLVRVLHREAEPSELTKGDDGLETQWDGKDDQGKPCPPGTYHARGVMVGDLGVEGVGFIGNDWVDADDSPHIRKITGLSTDHSRGEPILAVQLVGSSGLWEYCVSLKINGDETEAELVNAREIKQTSSFHPFTDFDLKDVTDSCSGPDGKTSWKFTPWVIQKGIVKQYSEKGGLLRTLLPASDDPPAVRIASSMSATMFRGASPDSLSGHPLFGAFANGQQLYVLYENATLQRLRGYDFTGVKPGEEPKVLFEQDILASDTYEQIASELKFSDEKPFVPSPVLTVALVPNPLSNNKPGTLAIKAGVDKEGCFLETADGLPLSHISDTKKLLWAVMGRPTGSKVITLFDSDGAVVEQFQINDIANMMAFDAGAVPWSGETAAPTPTPSATPSPTATPSPSPAATPAAPAKR